MLKIYNTLTRQKEEFKPVKEGFASMYVCGPTVYGLPHLGHAKSYINFDTVFRYLSYLGYKVKYVQNITDVGHLVGDGDDGEDKISKQAKKEQLDAYQIAYKYETSYFNEMDKLNVQRPSISCRATGFVYEMIETVKQILDNGYAYVSKDNNVYFDVRKYEKYGQLSHRKLDENVSGERIEVSKDKKNPEDFALWKSVPENTLMKWQSPWGVGCPGWHIECTTLGRKFLGEEFDIHGGGIDNVFPHHECECAQADAAYGKLPMRYFMHNGLVTVNGTKMGKSLGNFITLADLFQKFDPMTVRFFILQFHYRSSVDFSDEGLLLAEKQLAKINELVSKLRQKTTCFDNVEDPELLAVVSAFNNAMDEDFNTSVALVEFNKLVKILSRELENSNSKILGQINTLVKKLGEDVLGLKFKTIEAKKEEISQEIQELANQRWQAKVSKDWQKADELRNLILSKGYEILDNKSGFELKKK